MTRLRIRFVPAILIFTILLWMIPGDVAYLIAQGREVYLGRYAEGHVCVLIALTLISVLGIIVRLAPAGRRKFRSFAVVAVSLGLVFGLVVTDVVLRWLRRPRYIQTQGVYHRPHETQVTGVFRDIPEPRHAFPSWSPGYDDIHYQLTTDHRGFRNPGKIDTCDILFLGDSFVEGSGVSDDQTWPAVFSHLSARTTYNLGMPGGNPSTYLETLDLFGRSLQPQFVVCLIYEGNDFRGDGTITVRQRDNGETYNDRDPGLFKGAPLRLELKKVLAKALAWDSRNRFLSTFPGWQTFPFSSKRLDAIRWLPVAVPSDGPVYAFDLKRFVHHYRDRKSETPPPGLQTVTTALTAINTICNDIDARLIVAYAPDKQHVLAPLLGGVVAPDTIRNYVSLKLDDLPAGGEVYRQLCENVETTEDATRAFCGTQQIAFVSLTAPLRAAVAAGEQPYFSYDQHWTPVGHGVAARTLMGFVD